MGTVKRESLLASDKVYPALTKAITASRTARSSEWITLLELEAAGAPAMRLSRPASYMRKHRLHPHSSRPTTTAGAKLLSRPSRFV